MNPIKFNATNHYQYMKILGREGVYSSEQIDPHSLPAGFYHYSLIQENNSFRALSVKPATSTMGSLISKEQFALPPNEDLLLESGDCRFLEKTFDFESFFGCKLNIDTQIEEAEIKREQLLNSARTGRQPNSFQALDSTDLQL